MSLPEKIADSAGVFTTEVKQKGSYIIAISAVGYQEARQQVAVTGNSTNITITLKNIDSTLSIVSVTARSPWYKEKLIVS